jgi:hypothetical protein
MSESTLGAFRPQEPPGRMPTYYGKYRGRVEANLDEELMGRIQVSCPAVPGLRLGWAMPCVPYAGPGVGWFAIPPIGADVWVEFEGGDPNYPIWSGCFWQPGEIPIPPGDPNTKAFVTTACRMVMNDLVEAGGGWSVEVDLAAAAIATSEEAQSASAEGADAGIMAADAAVDASGSAIAASTAGVAADAVGDAEAAASDAEWAAMEAETVEDDAAEAAGEVPGVYSIVIDLAGITVSAPISEIRMTPETITLTVPESVMNMTSGSVTITVPEATLSITPPEILATVPPGIVSIGPEAVVLSIADTNQALSEPGIEIEAPTTSITGIVEIEGNTSVTGSFEVEGNSSLLGTVEIDGLNVEVAAPAIELNAADINELGFVSVEGDIVMDGAQVLAI